MLTISFYYTIQKSNFFLKEELKLELHKDKSRILPLSQGIDFVGFRNFYHFKLLRKRNIRNMISKVKIFHKGGLTKKEILESFQGFNAHAKYSNSYKLRKILLEKFTSQNKFLPNFSLRYVFISRVSRSATFRNSRYRLFKFLVSNVASRKDTSDICLRRFMI